MTSRILVLYSTKFRIKNGESIKTENSHLFILLISVLKISIEIKIIQYLVQTLKENQIKFRYHTLE